MPIDIPPSVTIENPIVVERKYDYAMSFGQKGTCHFMLADDQMNEVEGFDAPCGKIYWLLKKALTEGDK